LRRPHANVTELVAPRLPDKLAPQFQEAALLHVPPLRHREPKQERDQLGVHHARRDVFDHQQRRVDPLVPRLELLVLRLERAEPLDAHQQRARPP
jgi:hypothetical protein